ncbi:hypothetical protein UFOVP1305_62 [uncultured Caudovirales phage]|uniref:Uncharacterized protein n=1 Tax=uncultured Caudovirales phage TaxID=2100421 RepID=A0A6J5RLA5_9CAUD|nr:hypothetical protein UFOVP896_7 [uncultured Caudovirales phage]CAB4198250.1 hypothetical protein UFOVP1305_62 [uncultured Caudovirales phage]
MGVTERDRSDRRDRPEQAQSGTRQQIGVSGAQRAHSRLSCSFRVVALKPFDQPCDDLRDEIIVAGHTRRARLVLSHVDDIERSKGFVLSSDLDILAAVIPEAHVRLIVPDLCHVVIEVSDDQFAAVSHRLRALIASTVAAEAVTLLTMMRHECLLNLTCHVSSLRVEDR